MKPYQHIFPANPHPLSNAHKRAKRLRVSWFVLGTAFGIMSSTAVSLLINNNSSDEVAEQVANQPLPVGVALTDDAKKLPVLKPQSANATIAGTADDSVQEQASAQEWPREVEITLSNGDTISNILEDQGVSKEVTAQLIKDARKTFNPRSLKAGLNVRLLLDKDTSRKGEDAAILKHLAITLSKVSEIQIDAQKDGGFNIKRIEKKLQAKTARGGGVISEKSSSIYEVASRSGMPRGVVSEIIKAFSYDIDFQRDLHHGDRIDVLYEKMVTDKGETIKSGDVLYAEMIIGGKSYKIYHFEDDGVGRFYNENGESIVKQLLRTPIDGARISSGYGMRLHPIMGYSKMHKGIDFAAPRGTPIYAAGDGVVTFAAQKNGYGNFVQVKHNGTYSTAYGHCTGFASGIRAGRKVRQGQVIAYVGSTGRSTGPHLHYEILKAGVNINPAGVQFAGSNKLSGNLFAKFQQQKNTIKSNLASLVIPGETKVASK